MYMTGQAHVRIVRGSEGSQRQAGWESLTAVAKPRRSVMMRWDAVRCGASSPPMTDIVGFFIDTDRNSHPTSIILEKTDSQVKMKGNAVPKKTPRVDDTATCALRCRVFLAPQGLKNKVVD